jgi:hypothetical protein
MPDKQAENKLPVAESKALTDDEFTEKTKKFFSDSKLMASFKNEMSEYHLLIDTDKDKLTPTQKKRKIELVVEIMQVYGLENGLWATNLGRFKYHHALAEIRRKIVDDYDCHTAIELMIADRIVANYWLTMRNDTLLNHYMENEDGSFSINQLKINMIREFNRGIDRASRQLNADIMLLKELKHPKLNIKINTENAYIAQNQQVINTDKDESKSVNNESLKADNLGKK